MGQGKHGKTYDCVGESEDDRETLLHELSLPDARGCRWHAYVVERKGRVRRVMCDVRGQAMILASLRLAHGFVAKTFLGASNRTASESFDLELAMRKRVVDAFGGSRRAAEFTTVASGMPVQGMGGELIGLTLKGSTDSFYMVSSKCQVALDRYRFKSTAEIVEMARDILDSFSVIHKAGLIHADVKLDNMVLCRQGPGRRFKLIDWGASMQESALVRQYLSSGEPKNTLSPMAWYAWGLGRHMTSNAFVLIHTRMYLETIIKSLGFVKFCASAMSSFAAAVKRIEQQVGDEKEARRVIMATHVRSFDLYSFGILLAHLVFTSRVERRQGRRLLALARALTHYNAANFVGNDAEAAARMLN